MSSRCANNMMELVNEINKLTLYCQGKGYSEVTPDIVELCCPPDLSGKIFDIMDACGSGNAKTALGTLDKLIANKDLRTADTNTFRGESVGFAGCSFKRQPWHDPILDRYCYEA